MKKLMSIALLALLGFTASTNAFLFWGRGNCCGNNWNWGYSRWNRGCCGGGYNSCCGGYGYGGGYGYSGFYGGYYGW